MKLDVTLSNGPACISAEWIHELNIWGMECAYTDDCLPVIAPLFTSPISANPSLPLTAQDIGPDEARLLAGSAKAAILT